MDASLFTRPNKPDHITVKRRETGFALNPALINMVKPKLLAVSADTECHVTPNDTADFMANSFSSTEGKTFF